jgi:hypothetical protein
MMRFRNEPADQSFNDSNVKLRTKDKRSALRPPRFSLAAMFVVVAIFAVLFATATYVGLYATLLLVLFALTVLAHVAGNAIGTQLRDSGNRQPRDDTSGWRQKQAPLESYDFAPTSQLHHRTSLGRTIVITTVSGSIAGAVSGGYGLATLMERPTWQVVAIGVIASAVLSGIWSFAATSFFKTAVSALRQATRDAK